MEGLSWFVENQNEHRNGSDVAGDSSSEAHLVSLSIGVLASLLQHQAECLLQPLMIWPELIRRKTMKRKHKHQSPFTETSLLNYMSDFRMHFRVNRQTFEVLLRHFSQYPLLKSSLQSGKEPVTLHKSLLVFLWTLATTENLRCIAERFNMTSSGVYYCLKKMMGATLKHFCPIFVKWPPESKRAGIAKTFSRIRGLPNVIGALDVTHIPIKIPHANPESFLNSDRIHTVLLQAVCDAEMYFTDCIAGWPGGAREAYVLYNSELYVEGPRRCSPNFCIIANSIYPLEPWLLVPYQHSSNLPEPAKHFNSVFTATHAIIGHAFTLLKSRFRRLKYMDFDSVEDISKLIVTCCVLHNVCLAHEDSADDLLEWEEYKDMDASRECDKIGQQKREMIAASLWSLHGLDHQVSSS